MRFCNRRRFLDLSCCRICFRLCLLCFRRFFGSHCFFDLRILRLFCRRYSHLFCHFRSCQFIRRRIILSINCGLCCHLYRLSFLSDCRHSFLCCSVLLNGLRFLLCLSRVLHCCRLFNRVLRYGSFCVHLLFSSSCLFRRRCLCNGFFCYSFCLN